MNILFKIKMIFLHCKEKPVYRTWKVLRPKNTGDVMTLRRTWSKLWTHRGNARYKTGQQGIVGNNRYFKSSSTRIFNKQTHPLVLLGLNNSRSVVQVTTSTIINLLHRRSFTANPEHIILTGRQILSNH